MKTIVLFTSTLLLFSACNSSTAHLSPECQQLNSELSQLKNKKYENLTAQLATKLQVNQYPFQDKEKLDQKIKVLEMKLEECK